MNIVEQEKIEHTRFFFKISCNKLSDFDKSWHGHASCALKQAYSIDFLIFSQSYKLCPFGQISTKFDPINYISVRGLDTAHLILAKFGIDIVLDPRYKPPYFLFFFSKSKTAAGSQMVNFDKFSADKLYIGTVIGYCMFIIFGQNLRGTYYLTLVISVSKWF